MLIEVLISMFYFLKHQLLFKYKVISKILYALTTGREGRLKKRSRCLWIFVDATVDSLHVRICCYS